jgi:hypothetical protein
MNPNGSNHENSGRRGKPFEWPSEARDFVMAHRNAAGQELVDVVSYLGQLSGHPQDACLRFARKHGITARTGLVRRRWTEADDQQLLGLYKNHSVPVLARILECSQSAVWNRLGRLDAKRNAQPYRWSQKARSLVLNNRKAEGSELRGLIRALAQESGNPRRECWRFAHRMGVKNAFRYRRWTESEQQRLLHLMEKHTLPEVAQRLRRSERAVREKLEDLGANACIGKDWFTPRTLAVAIHTAYGTVQQWIDRNLLKVTEQNIGTFKRVLITAGDFCKFCKEHRQELIGHRLNLARLDFIQNFVFPPSHAELLPVRAAKKEQAAYQAQTSSQEADDIGLDDLAGVSDAPDLGAERFPPRAEDRTTGSMRGEVCA